MTANTIIIGIDPGLNRTGFGVIRIEGENFVLLDAGVIENNPKDPLPMRVKKLFISLNSLLEQHNPSVLSLEEIYSHYRHPRTAILMSHARGVICCCAALKNIEVKSYSATLIKKALTGNGRSSKEQVQAMVGKYLGLVSLPAPLDITDALAVAIAHFFISSSKIK